MPSIRCNQADVTGRDVLRFANMSQKLIVQRPKLKKGSI